MNRYLKLLALLAFLGQAGAVIQAKSPSNWPTKLQALRIANKAWEEGKAEIEADIERREELRREEGLQYKIAKDHSHGPKAQCEALDRLKIVRAEINKLFSKRINAAGKAKEAAPDFPLCILSAVENEISGTSKAGSRSASGCIEAMMKKAAYAEYAYPDNLEHSSRFDKILSEKMLFKTLLKGAILYDLCVADILFLINDKR